MMTTMTSYCEYIEKMLRTATSLTGRLLQFHLTFIRQYTKELVKEIKDMKEKSKK